MLQSDKNVVPRLQDQRTNFSLPGARLQLQLFPEHQYHPQNSMTPPSHLTGLPFFLVCFLIRSVVSVYFKALLQSVLCRCPCSPRTTDAAKLSCGTFLLSVLQLSSISTAYSFSNSGS